MDLSADRVVIARGLLQWSQLELAFRSGVSREAVARLEAGERQASNRTIAAIRSALEAGGVAFTSPATLSLRGPRLANLRRTGAERRFALRDQTAE